VQPNVILSPYNAKNGNNKTRVKSENLKNIWVKNKNNKNYNVRNTKP
jgi:hypothetical protein